jgi:CheY-like chemotaxis protein
VRAVFEMTDILSGAEDLPALLEFEVRLRRDVLARHRCLALCLYDQARIHPVLAQALARVHPFPAWSEAVLRNRSCEAPGEVLAGLREGQPRATEARAPISPPQDGVPPLPRGSETVLLVEYHPQVRRNVADALASLGYTVLQASDTRDIPQVLRSHQGAVDLLLTDIVGDEEDGFLLAHALADRLSRPGLVLLTACASRSALGAHPPGVRQDLLVRAAAITAVATAVRQVLDARAAERP